MVVRIADYLSSFSTYEDGGKIYELICPALLRGDVVVLSFDSILSVPSAFINAALVRLLEVMPFDHIKSHLKIVDTTRQINALIKQRFAFSVHNEVFVEPRAGGRWAVITDENEQAVSLHTRKDEAITRARELAINKGAQLIIKDRDGRIMAKDSHGDDPRRRSFTSWGKRRNQVSVEPRPEGRWAVQTDGTERADSLHDRKEDAVRRARELAQNKQAELVIKDREGRITGKDSHSDDPREIRG